MLTHSNSTIRVLHLRWLNLAILAALFLAGLFLILYQAWQPEMAWRWLALACLPTAFLLVSLWRGLPLNIRHGEMTLLSNLGPGNLLTFARGMLTAALAGFLFLPQPPGGLAWLPGSIYVSAATADLFDGYLARRSNHVTHLGEMLDMNLDGLGVLIGATLLVQYEKAPGFYLLVGLARYLFLAGIWLRRRLGKPVFDLAPSATRRPFAGAQMGFIGVALLPIFIPPGIALVAACFALPFLVGFLMDWLTVSGYRRDASKTTLHAWERLNRNLSTWGVLVLRLAVAGAVFWILASFFGSNSKSGPTTWAMIAMYAFGFLGGSLMLAGAAGRTAALAVLFSMGVLQHYAQPGFLEILVIVGSTAVFFLGSGAYSIWKPETRLISKRIGEA